MPLSILYIFVVIVAGIVIYFGSDMLEKSAGKLSRHYALPAAVHGGIVVAVGSSFPELSSTVLSTLRHGAFELGLSSVIGSAIFNILIIPALSRLIAKENMKPEKLMVYKDAQFYIISVAVLLIAFSLAIIYYPTDEGALTGKITTGIAIIPLLIYGLYLFIQQQELKESKLEREKLSKPVITWLKLIFSLILVVVGVEGLVKASLFYGEYFNIPSFFWGLTMIAILTSMPDAIVSFKMAKRRQHTSSLTNVLGSNIFDLLVAIPVGIILAGSASVNFAVAVPLMGLLTLATILLFAFLRTSLEINRTEAWILLVTYFLMILWIILESAGILNSIFSF